MSSAAIVISTLMVNVPMCYATAEYLFIFTCKLNVSNYEKKKKKKKDYTEVERKTIVTQTYFWNPCLGATWTPL